jgi:acetoin utilization protein AcuB
MGGFMSFSVGDKMVKYPYYTTENMLIEEALEYMQDCEIRHLPVVDRDKLVGIVSERDILSYRGLNKSDELTVGDIMETNPYAVGSDEKLSAVVRKMAKEKMGSALIIDEQSHIIGIFTVIDALLLLEQLLEGEGDLRLENDRTWTMKDAPYWV